MDEPEVKDEKQLALLASKIASALEEQVPDYPLADEIHALEYPHDPDDIIALKKSGAPKPHFIPWSTWNQPQQLNHKHRLLIEMAAIGKSTSEIATAIGVSLHHVRRLLRGPVIRAAIDERMKSAFALELLKDAEPIAKSALAELAKILADPNARDSAKIEAAKLLASFFVSKK